MIADYTPAEEQPFLWDPTTWEGAESALGRKRIRAVLTAPVEPIETGLADSEPEAPRRRAASSAPKGKPKARPKAKSKPRAKAKPKPGAKPAPRAAARRTRGR